MEKIIKAAVDRGASDLHIKAGDVFRARIDGKLIPLTKQALTPDQTRSIALKLIANEDDRARLDKLQDYDCSWGAPGIGRFRVNILRQRSSFMVVMRVIPFEVPGFDRLGVPEVLKAIATAPRGLILVAGGTGSGRSTTMAAMLNHINQHENKHIVTLENPIEFLHRDLQSSVTQREVGVDTESVQRGLRAALRQDPDVILLGELPDAETIETALQAAETGRLVISTVNAADAQGTLSRLLALFPPDEQDGIRVRLADALHAVVSQRLLQRADGKGRVGAFEILIATPAVRKAMLEADDFGGIRELLEEESEEGGIQTFDQHLEQLVADGTVEKSVALAASPDPEELGAQLQPPKRSGGKKKGEGKS